MYSVYTNVLSSFSRHRNFTLSSSIFNYKTTNDINDPPTLTFSTKANIQESSEPFTTRVSAKTTTRGNVFSSSDLFSVDSTINNHDSTHTITDDLHYTDPATDKTTSSQGPTQSVIDDLTSNGNVSTAIDDIHSTEAATNKTTESHGTTQTVINDHTSNGDILTARVDIHSTEAATDKTTESHATTQTVTENLTGNNENISTATVDIHSTDSATDKTNSISLASTDAAITLSHSGASI